MVLGAFQIATCSTLPRTLNAAAACPPPPPVPLEVAEPDDVEPDEVPLNFLIPNPGTPFAHLEVPQGADALMTVAAFRLALPRTVLRFAGGRELTLGDLGAEDGGNGPAE